MNNKIKILLLCLLPMASCQKKTKQIKSDKNEIIVEKKQKIDPDSVSLVAAMFLLEGFSDDSKYYLEEPDIHKVYTNSPKLVERYFPLILENYQELKYYQQLNIAYYLYLLDDKIHFANLKDKANKTSEEERILNWYISNYKMKF